MITKMKAGSLIKNFDELVRMRSGRLAAIRRRLVEAAELGLRRVMPENLKKKLKARANVQKVHDTVTVDLR